MRTVVGAALALALVLSASSPASAAPKKKGGSGGRTGARAAEQTRAANDDSDVDYSRKVEPTHVTDEVRAAPQPASSHRTAILLKMERLAPRCHQADGRAPGRAANEDPVRHVDGPRGHAGLRAHAPRPRP